ncbi:MAG: alpha/beta-type small acid-soluble spore protein [Bacillota bacterium]
MQRITQYNTNQTTSDTLVPEARAALRRFRDQIATEFGLDFTGYNGDKTSWECGKVGGEMVRRMIETAERNMSGTTTTTTTTTRR